MSDDSPLVRLTIDGQEVAVPPTKIAYDPLSKKKVEIPTTIYDAALALVEKNGGKNPIPILCHREHINPVAVCRVCVVDVGGRVLAPACFRAVEEGMKVQTAATSRRVRDTISTVTELLMADHPAPCAKHREHGDCELEVLAQNLGVVGGRLPGPARPRPRDESSLVIAVDHSACILCDRCVRACNDIRDNQVIGRMAKGYQAQIAFDLNSPMGDSTCVACGECMVSCPTGALVNRRAVQQGLGSDGRAPVGEVDPDELAKHPLFEGVSPAFLRWNAGAVVRRRFRKGDLICREGEFGSTAFLIEQGKVKVFIQSPMKHVKSRKGRRDRTGWGPFGLIQHFRSSLVRRDEDQRDEEGMDRFIHIDAPVSLQYDNPVATLGPGDIFGEMTCMNSYPRSATVQAEEDCTVLEMLRNVLYILQRSKKSRAWLEERYRARTIDTHLRSVPIFAGLLREDEEKMTRVVNFLRPRVQLLRLNPGEMIFRQGDVADGFYLVRVGFVKVSQRRPGGEQVLQYVGPGGHFGEIGLLSHLEELRELAPPGLRTATCSALDHVDLVRISADDFGKLMNHLPDVRERLVKKAIADLESDVRARQEIERVPLGEFLQQGLMNAQSLLVLDLEKCTRCDECTRACADSHDGVTRLVREGLRFDKWLVASSCRSCLDPYCMVGCPVGSIRRRGTREIIIEDWCIGCGKCAENCPYGNINMHGFEELQTDPANPSRQVAVVQQKATLCDLCAELDGQPSCVYACPHDAAHRMSGRELLEEVRQGRGERG
jgi:CRP-like cAMP-binding protein/Fe-S-cluster-containing hydrogenase component 2